MEPVACLFEACDAAVAYLFWLSTHNEMEMSNIEENFFQKKANKVYKNLSFDKHEFMEN